VRLGADREYIVRPIALGSDVLNAQTMLASNDSPVPLDSPRRQRAGMSRCGLITYGGQLVAIATPRRVLLMPPISALESDHPRRRFVATLALVWREMRCGPEPEVYDPSVAQFYARWILMPNHDFARVAPAMSDAELAERFNVPVEQVTAKRADFQVAIRTPITAAQPGPSWSRAATTNSPGGNDEDPCVL
jgi:hypothetical protein